VTELLKGGTLFDRLQQVLYILSLVNKRKEKIWYWKC